MLFSYVDAFTIGLLSSQHVLCVILLIDNFPLFVNIVIRKYVCYKRVCLFCLLLADLKSEILILQAHIEKLQRMLVKPESSIIKGNIF